MIHFIFYLSRVWFHSVEVELFFLFPYHAKFEADAAMGMFARCIYVGANFVHVDAISFSFLVMGLNRRFMLAIYYRHAKQRGVEK